MTKRKNPEDILPKGAPSKYRPEYKEQVKKLCYLGATDEEIANFFEVCVATINNWKIEYPDFLESLREGKMIADANVSESLYKRAIGYEHKEDKIFQYKGEEVVVPTVKHYPPDTDAVKFWLKNRRPDIWRDKQEIVNLNDKPFILEMSDEADSKAD